MLHRYTVLKVTDDSDGSGYHAGQRVGPDSPVHGVAGSGVAEVVDLGFEEAFGDRGRHGCVDHITSGSDAEGLHSGFLEPVSNCSRRAVNWTEALCNLLLSQVLAVRGRGGVGH